jgi:hypothetical protein
VVWHLFGCSTARSGVAIFATLIHWTARKNAVDLRNMIETESSTESPRNEKTIPFSTRSFGPAFHPEHKNPWQDVASEELAQIICSIQSGGRDVLAATRVFQSSHLCSAALCPSATFVSRRESLWWVLKETIFGAP